MSTCWRHARVPSTSVTRCSPIFVERQHVVYRRRRERRGGHGAALGRGRVFDDGAAAARLDRAPGPRRRRRWRRSAARRAARRGRRPTRSGTARRSTAAPSAPARRSTARACPAPRSAGDSRPARCRRVPASSGILSSASTTVSRVCSCSSRVRPPPSGDDRAVLDDDDRHREPLRQRLEQRRQRVQPAERRPDRRPAPARFMRSAGTASRWPRAARRACSCGMNRSDSREPSPRMPNVPRLS